MTRRKRLKPTSRYKSTTLYQDGRELTFFGRWVPPAIPEDNRADQYHLVRDSDVGRLDLLAYQFYGNPALWWVIAQANNITNPLNLEGIESLRIPSPSRVEALTNSASFPES